MDRLIYLSMSGAKATLQRQDVLANNLANVSTNGFRAELDGVSRACRCAATARARASMRSSRRSATTPTPGPVQATGRPLDVAMKGNAWLAVQALDGTEAYTRAGALRGRRRRPARHAAPACRCSATAGRSRVPAERRRSRSAATARSAPTSARRRPQQVGRLKLVTPEAPLERGNDGLFRGATARTCRADTTARVQNGALEGSNVSPVETMVAMIAAARQFEQQMKMLQGAEQRDQAAAKLLAPQ